MIMHSKQRHLVVLLLGTVGAAATAATAASSWMYWQPALPEVLTDVEIWAVRALVKSHWLATIKAR